MRGLMRAVMSSLPRTGGQAGFSRGQCVLDLALPVDFLAPDHFQRAGFGRSGHIGCPPGRRCRLPAPPRSRCASEGQRPSVPVLERQHQAIAHRGLEWRQHHRATRRHHVARRVFDIHQIAQVLGDQRQPVAAIGVTLGITALPAVSVLTPAGTRCPRPKPWRAPARWSLPAAGTGSRRHRGRRCRRPIRGWSDHSPSPWLRPSVTVP